MRSIPDSWFSEGDQGRTSSISVSAGCSGRPRLVVGETYQEGSVGPFHDKRYEAEGSPSSVTVLLFKYD